MTFRQKGSYKRMEMLLHELGAAKWDGDFKDNCKEVYEICLSNDRGILVTEKPVHNGTAWEWKVNGAVFGKEEYAVRYLRTLVAESLTGKRIIFHKKREAPAICGVDGAACRAKGECNRALCTDCPVAEKFFADRDGVELVYAV